MEQIDVNPPMGWLGIDETQRAFAAQFPLLSDTAPQLYGVGGDEPVLLYKAWKDVLKDYPAYKAQEIGSCFPAGTMVLGEATKAIEDVRVGDLVWTGEGKLTRVVSTREIVSYKPLVTISLRGSTPLVCTADHRVLARKFLAANGERASRDVAADNGRDVAAAAITYKVSQIEWVAAGDLTADHYLVAPADHELIPLPDDPILSPFLATEDGRRLLGFLLGGGRVRGGSVEFVGREPEVLAKYLSIAEAIVASPRRVRSRPGRLRRVRMRSTALARCFRKWFHDANGVKAFPGWAVGDPAVLEGLRDSGDNSRDGREVGHDRGDAIQSTNRGVVYGAIATLRTLGYDPVVQRVARSRATKSNAKPLYRVWCADAPQEQRPWRNGGFVHHQVTGIRFQEGPTVVYDIGVADSHHSFVADGFAVHNCVGHGFAHANDCLQCVEIALGEGSEYRETSAEFIYAASREVAGIRGNQDGSYGAAAVKAAQQVGLASREMLGADGVDSGRIAKEWGRSGPPAKYKEAAAKFKLGSAALVKTWDDLLAAVRNGYPITIASNQGFTMTRDAQGFCSARGSWAHQMCITGVRFDREGALICQSWGPTNPSGPTALDQPSFSFWAERRVVEGILRQGDSWALSGAPDFVKRDLPSRWSYASLA